jgi:hypothetical protein
MLIYRTNRHTNEKKEINIKTITAARLLLSMDSDDFMYELGPNSKNDLRDGNEELAALWWKLQKLKYRVSSKTATQM